MDKRGDVVTLVFPVCKSGTHWVDAVSKKPIDIGPTHWRPWSNGLQDLMRLEFFLVCCGQLFKFCLFLGEQARFHFEFGRIGFGFQKIFEPVDVRLDDFAHRKIPSSRWRYFTLGRIEQP